MYLACTITRRISYWYFSYSFYAYRIIITFFIAIYSPAFICQLRLQLELLLRANMDSCLYVIRVWRIQP